VLLRPARIEELPTRAESVQHIGKRSDVGLFYLDEHRGCPAHLLWHVAHVALGRGWLLEQLCDSATSHLGI